MERSTGSTFRSTKNFRMFSPSNKNGNGITITASRTDLLQNLVRMAGSVDFEEGVEKGVCCLPSGLGPAEPPTTMELPLNQHGASPPGLNAGD
ncbi:hypothetical protein CDAR_426241 [Caerostris darwini]|uniref:Uncharacterized protein n=1 Tax=Caerostris darwini TaxID=1538125 RepID=A0AAV4UKJ7_9ARAC|nr:hypothetical protein CDAR_426241 [Caerostris darwini]